MSLHNAKFLIVFLMGLMVTTAAFANNLNISNVSLGSRDPGAKTLVIKFDIQWENSWRNKINHDAAWLTVRLNSTTASPTYKKLCQVSASGLNPAGSSVGNAQNIEFYVPSDKRGLFVRRSSYGPVANISSQNAQVTVSYDSCGFTDSDTVSASVFGLEMVYIPQGSFNAGDYNTSVASLNRGNADNNPWYINSENAIAVANPVANGFRYISNNNSGEYASGSIFTIPAVFPKGFAPFYVMKYEITEGEWIEFVNALPTTAARSSRDLTDNNHKNSDNVLARNTIACSGSPLACSSTRPARPASFLTWMDVVAFLDWAALRPLTELEFEKIARGPILPVAGEYIWGTTAVTPASTISGNEDGTETSNGNANVGNVTFSGGDAAADPQSQQGALRAGIFATVSSTRELAGASYYGVMDLGGNLKERVVTIGNASGLGFSGLNGDGVLSSGAGFEGNANEIAWPGLDANAANGVTNANGSGFRGGSWAASADRFCIFDR